MHISNNITHIPALCLLGPTATGKTTIAIALGQYMPIEVISVDSAMVYRGMNVGTGKPTTIEQAGIPHHLIDIRNPENTYSVAEFRQDALTLIREIAARGKLPVLVGGTMLYFKALITGLSSLPPQNPAIRATLIREAAEKGWITLHKRLQNLDPIIAERIQPTDTQRIQRALEVIQLTGKPLSAHYQDTPTISCEILWRQIGLMVHDREPYHYGIAKRFYAMCANGFEQEVRTLKENLNLSADTPAMRAVGYRQMWMHLEGHLNYVTMQANAIAATRQLAKRQITWMRSWKNLQLFDWQTQNLLNVLRTSLLDNTNTAWYNAFSQMDGN